MSIKYIITEVRISAVKVVYKVFKYLADAGFKLVKKLERSEKRIAVLKAEYVKLTNKQAQSEQLMRDKKEMVTQRHEARVANLQSRIKSEHEVKDAAIYAAECTNDNTRSMLGAKKANVQDKLS